MNRCEDYQEMISRMLDGELSKAERSALAEHVKRCPDCAAVYVAFRSLSESLGDELEEPPRRIRENIMAELRRDEVRRRNRANRSHQRWHAVLTAAACLVLIVAAGMALPKIVTRGRSASAGAPEAAVYSVANEQRSAADAVLQNKTPAEAPSLSAPAPEPTAGAALSDTLYAGNTVSEDTAQSEECSEAEIVIASGASEDDPIVLNKSDSDALIEIMTYEKVPLERAPDRELYLLYWTKDGQKPLTVFFCGKEAVYVFADGDSYCRFAVSADELLELLGIA